MTQSSIQPKWIHDVVATLPVHSHYLVWGSVHDLQLVAGPDGAPAPVDAVTALGQALRDDGVQVLLVHDPVTGIAAVGDPQACAQISDDLGLVLDSGAVTVTPVRLAQLTRDLQSPACSLRAAMVITYAARLCNDPSNLSGEEHQFFTSIEQASRTARPRAVESGPARFNPVVWMAGREQEFPHWVLADNDQFRTVVASPPDLGQREAIASFALSITGYDSDAAGDMSESASRVANATDSMSLRSVRDCVRLGRALGLAGADLDDAVRSYRVGLAENPWRRGYLKERIEEGEDSVGGRVLGQAPAITAAFDILKRSVLGLSGAHATSSGGRPHGILFFAGPTGVGKTELAKAITRVVFGDDSAYVRFDMSEYAAEQSEARLIGAPPGYVGYDAGGQLTDAVQRQPFSLLLFDEIEKAHPRILDKFLQILEDGRLTDSRGGTVHFSETLIVFTSNLGIFRELSSGERVPLVDESMPYEELSRTIRDAVGEHFTTGIGRPELLNRIGENIVVFSFIAEEVAGQIFDLQLRNVVDRVREEHEIELDFDPAALASLRAACTADRSLGGRGIGNQVEALLVNPLARSMFTVPSVRSRLQVSHWGMDDGVAIVEVQ